MGYLTEKAFGSQPGTQLGNGRGNYSNYTLDALAQGQILSPEGDVPYAGYGMAQPGNTGIVPPKPNVPTFPGLDPGKPNVQVNPGLDPTQGNPNHPRFRQGQWLNNFSGLGGGGFGPFLAMFRQNRMNNGNYLGRLGTPDA